MTASKPSPKPSPKNYAELESELQAIIAWFDSGTFDVDEAVNKYKRGLELIQQLEKYLDTAENTVRELKATFNQATK